MVTLDWYSPFGPCASEAPQEDKEAHRCCLTAVSIAVVVVADCVNDNDGRTSDEGQKHQQVVQLVLENEENETMHFAKSNYGSHLSVKLSVCLNYPSICQIICLSVKITIAG